MSPDFLFGTVLKVGPELPDDVRESVFRLVEKHLEVLLPEQGRPLAGRSESTRGWDCGCSVHHDLGMRSEILVGGAMRISACFRGDAGTDAHHEHEANYSFKSEKRTRWGRSLGSE